jgi:hypothetical protein
MDLNELLKQSKVYFNKGIEEAKKQSVFDKIFTVTGNLFPPFVEYKDIFKNVEEGEEIPKSSFTFNLTEQFQLSLIEKNSVIIETSDSVLKKENYREMYFMIMERIGEHAYLMHDKNSFKELEEQSFTTNTTSWNTGILTTMVDAWQVIIDRGFNPKVWLLPLKYMYNFLDALDTVRWYDKNIKYYFSRYIDTSYGYLIHPFDNLYIKLMNANDMISVRTNFDTGKIETKITVRDLIRIEDVKQIERFSLSI